jgi:hypothetical protein
MGRYMGRRTYESRQKPQLITFKKVSYWIFAAQLIYIVLLKLSLQTRRHAVLIYKLEAGKYFRLNLSSRFQTKFADMQSRNTSGFYEF